MRSSELNAIRPFEGSTVEFDPKDNHIPFEITRSRENLPNQRLSLSCRNVTSTIFVQPIMVDLNVSSIFHDLEGQPFFLPIYIGVYRYKETPYRIIVNGLNGIWSGRHQSLG